jgi:hypothetical protein
MQKFFGFFASLLMSWNVLSAPTFAQQTLTSKDPNVRVYKSFKVLGNRLYVQFQRPATACALLMQPGDLILQHFKEGEGEYELFGGEISPTISVATSVVTRLGEVLSLRNFLTSLSYGHTEVIYKIGHQWNEDIITWSFYPPLFDGKVPDPDAVRINKYYARYNKDSSDYRSNYSVYRARAFTDRGVQSIRERAVERMHYLELEFLLVALKSEPPPKIEKNITAVVETINRFSDRLPSASELLREIEAEREYARTQGGDLIINNRERAIEALIQIRDTFEYYGEGGLFSNCADFGNWALGNHLTGWWNVIPGLRSILAVAYPPEAVDSPKSLADSVFAKKICEVRSRPRIAFPRDANGDYQLESALVFPKDVYVQDLLDSIELSRQSSVSESRSHAEWVYRILLEVGAIKEERQRGGRLVVKPVYEFIRLESADIVTAEIRALYGDSVDPQKCKKTPGPFLFGLEECIEEEPSKNTQKVKQP